MTVEIEFSSSSTLTLADWQVRMSNDIEQKYDVSITDMTREVAGNTFVMRLDATLSDQDIEDMRSDIEDYLPSNAVHVETRQIE